MRTALATGNVVDVRPREVPVAWPLGLIFHDAVRHETDLEATDFSTSPLEPFVTTGCFTSIPVRRDPRDCRREWRDPLDG